MSRTKKQVYSGEILSIDLACYHAVHDYPGGVAAVASTFGWSKPVLQNKLNPTQGTHKLTAAEAEAILQLTKDSRIIDAVCHPMGAVWHMPTEAEASAHDMGLLESGADLMSSATGLIGEVVAALSDLKTPNEIDALEMDRILQKTYKLQGKAMGLTSVAKQFQKEDQA